MGNGKIKKDKHRLKQLWLYLFLLLSGLLLAGLCTKQIARFEAVPNFLVVSANKIGWKTKAIAIDLLERKEKEKGTVIKKRVE